MLGSRLGPMAFALWATLLTPLAWSADEHPMVPETLEGIQVVSAEQVMSLMEAGKGVIVDARKPEEFKSGTIPGAVNCQVSSGKPDLGESEITGTVEKLTTCEGLAKADKHQPVAIFCNGQTCWRSPKGALALKKMGYHLVHWYRLGGNDWKAKGLPLE